MLDSADEVYEFVLRQLSLEAAGSLAKVYAFHLKSNTPVDEHTESGWDFFVFSGISFQN